MGEGEPISFEERSVIALETAFPRHFSAGNVSAGEGLDLRKPVIIAQTCVGKFPATVEEIADHGLVSSCGSCGQSFVWTDRTQSWTAS